MRHIVEKDFTDSTGRHWPAGREFLGDEAVAKEAMAAGNIRKDGESHVSSNQGYQATTQDQPKAEHKVAAKPRKTAAKRK